jgi:poly(3-hydroxybutyrate) depolymerase
MLAAAPARADAVHHSPLPPGACATHGAVGRAYHVGVNCRVVEVNSHPRRFIVYVPSRAPVTGPRAPVVFMLHGTGGDGERFLRTSGWREQADATGALAVFPTGLRYRVLESGRLKTKWNDGELRQEVDLDERPRGYPEDAPWPADDVGFVDAIESDLAAQGRSTGTASTPPASRTAQRSRRAWRSTVLAAAGFAAGGLHEPRPIERPIPMYLTGGTRDAHILEQTGPPPLTELPLDPLQLLAEPIVRSTLGAHLGTLGLDATDLGTVGRPHSTAFRWPATGTGADGALFRFAMLEGLRHKYPNAGNNPLGFEAAPEFWRFFASHPLP